jgi:hypothetical protein
MTTEISPWELMRQIDEMARSLDSASHSIAEAIIDRGHKETAYRMSFERELIKIKDEYAGQRPPAEDLRRAMAHQRIDKKTYAEYLEADARVAALEAGGRMKRAAVSALQSLLATLRDEVKVGQM